jgi:serine/threonine protein kinase
MNQPASTAERALGRYHIVKPLKIGGTAAIYLAVMRGENNFSREVVVKRPLPHLVADQRARLMFVDEAHIASRLSHPNICQVLDLVAREDELYLVLEYLRGVDLREILKRTIQLGGLMPVEVAVYIAIETCSGLDFAHEAAGVDGKRLGIVHRDVSPKNIRITDSGSVKIIDFGIARALGRATETAVGTIKGTLGYMSPEQILGDEIDKRSDIFAFGICLFQMLTCRNPFDGPSLKERVRRLTQAPIPSPREFNAALDEEIEGIVARCLERDIDRRYQRMRDVQTDLDRYLAKLQVVSPRQRLIRFLEEIFPNLREADLDLKNALTEVSSVTGRISIDQRLIFPDDPPTEAGSGDPKTRPTMSASTASSASTVGAEAAKTKESTPSDTKPMAPAGLGVADPPARKPGSSEESQIATELDRTSPEQRPLPWGFIGAALAVVAIVVVVITVALMDDPPAIETAPIAPQIAPPVSPPPIAEALVEPPVAPPVSPPIAPPVSPPVAPPAPPPITAVEPPRKAPPAKHAETAAEVDRAKLFFKTGVRLARIGRADDARLAYVLAYAHQGKRPNASIYLNLGLLYNARQDIPKARACLRAYLDRSPDAPDAPRIRTLISAFPATKAVPCVAPAEVADAKKAYARQGAKIDAWVEDTVKEILE